MTLKFRLLLISFSGVVAVLIMGIFGLMGHEAAHSSVANLLGSLSNTRNQMEADMMHDAIRGDVLSGLLAFKNDNKTEVEAAEKDLAEHGRHFKEMFALNEKSENNPEVKKKITQLNPLIDQYLNAADSVFKTAKTDPQKTDTLLPPFQAQFDVLEKEMAALSDLIQHESAQNSQESEVIFASYKVKMMIFLVVVIVVMLTVSTLVSKKITGVLTYAISLAKDIASGDLRNQIEIKSTDEMGQLLLSLDEMQNNLAVMISKVSASAAEVIKLGLELAVQSQQMKHASEHQNQSAESMSRAIGQMTQSVAHVAGNARNAEILSADSAEQSHNGARMIEEVLLGMNAVELSVVETSGIIRNLGEQSDQIHSMVRVIKEIADQTNLLALNAAIEAARAGEQGRGFAVVADEVRVLASRTTQSTQDIAKVVDDILAGTRFAIDSMDKGVVRVKNGNEQAKAAAEVIQNTRAGAADVIKAVKDIAQAMQEQNRGSDEISGGIERIVSIAQENEQATHQAVETASRLNELAANLKVLISRFKLAGQQT